ncbi:hypothetical protein [Sagittula stellata]|uniref:Uncharacterized protein n=1 Tax=Sagittula stellata (strain ATCC 700073 / DSM 11524 / E-37) TaxID=388399 RepID=A3K206_SAGS3|nr:hypothetical protein [Sagittula stellata]EBA08952.1 hypothetical protein SSE37_04880 [Sagittula stellata E-37]
MQRPIVTLPPAFLRVLNVDWDIDWRETSLGDFNEGTTRTQFSGFPRWIGAPKVKLGRAQLGQWRAIRAMAQGRRGIYRIRMDDPAVFPISATGAGGTVIAQGKPSAAGNLFTNGRGWEYAPFALAAGDHAAGAEAIRVDVTSCNGFVPVVGQIMSHASWPFQVTYVRARGGAVFELGVQMPLRAAIAQGDILQLRGVGVFEAAESGMGRIDYDRSHRAMPELRFMEVPGR